MLKKIIVLLITIIIPGHLSAQVIVSLNSQSDIKEEILEQEDIKIEDATLDNAVEEGVQVSISPEEIIELETKSKKAIRRNIKNRDAKERENIIGVLTWQEKSLKIRELMREGKSYSEAKKIVEDTIKPPAINVKNDSEMEQYMYKKGNFISNGK